MKILVTSDSHRRKNILSDIIAMHKDADAIIFLGDGINDFEDALAENGLSYDDAAKEIIAVMGNCDAFGRETSHLVREIGGVKFYISHGAAENVKTGLFTLADAAKQNGCKVALYGHTHAQFSAEKKGVMLFNPGAVERGCYGLINIAGDTVEFSGERI